MLNPYIKQVQVTDNNNLVLKFSKPIYVFGELSTDDIQVKITQPEGKEVTNFEAIFEQVQELPSTSLFVRLIIGDFLRGADLACVVEVFYKRSGKLYDENLVEVESYSNAFSYLNKHNPEMTSGGKTILKILGIGSNCLLMLTIVSTVIIQTKLGMTM